MKLTHLGISYYRSIGEEPVTLDLTKKLNVLVGANNCGKSNVLRALVWYGSSKRTLDETDWHRRNRDKNPTIKLVSDTVDTDRLIQSALTHIELIYDATNERHGLTGDSNLSELGWDKFADLYYKTNGSYFSGRPGAQQQREHIAQFTFKLLNPHNTFLSRVGFIPVFREIRPSENYSISGQGVVKLLAQWHHPEIGADANHEKFERVQDLVRRLTDSPNVELEVSHKQDEIIVRRDGLRLPLTSYGTGIHELIILAIAVLSFDDSLVCVEEPEIHLHPLLQRRFIEFLRNKTTNRYVITTHSPALIAPAEDTNVIHLWLENGVTKSRTIATSADSLRALHDLGAQASDLLQANSVIWVEGPSDRTYLNRWLDLLHPGKYREGIDYTVMFYGGRLLSHLSMERDLVAETKEDEAAELIQLLKINQHSAILIDSDRRKATDPINATKQRIQTECAKSGVFCWITPGREIENSLPVAAIEATYSTLAEKPVTVKLKSHQKIEDALATSLKSVWKRASYYEHAKAQIAHQISAQLTAEQLSPDIRNLVAGIVKVIEHKLR